MQAQSHCLKFNFLMFALLSTLLGVLISFSAASSFILLLIFLIFLFLRHSNYQERKFISLLFIIGVVSRISITYFLHIFLKHHGFIEGDLFGDGGDNSARGWLLTQFWLGGMTNYYTLAYGYNMHGWTYIAGFFYLLFGHSPLGLKFINCLLSVLTGIIIYFIAKEIFSTKVGKLSALFTVFFPSLFLWSLSNLKDSSIIFSISVILWSFINFLKKRKVRYLVLLILALCLLAPLREGFGLCMFIVIGFSSVCISKISVIKKIGICLIAILVLQTFLFVKGKNLKSVVSDKLARIIYTHQSVVATGGSVYRLLDEKYYSINRKRTAEHPEFYFYNSEDMKLSDYANMLFKGWAHFLFEPFPWKIHTKQMLFSYPQMVFWYTLMPFAFLGMILAARYNWYLCSILFIYFFIIGSLLAMTEGNIGTVFRHRDIITPVLLLFASVGLVWVFGISRRDKL